MGEVWLANDTLLNRPVAVKFLQATKDAMYKEMFLSEARTLASLQHPNITLIYDAVFDERDNRFYIMMEYVEGKSLANLIEESEGPLPLQTIFDITTGILRALKYAHSKSIVHRDIKPENIVIQEGQVKLTDFGLAALVSILAEQKSGYIIGTPSYMPPEQILGEGVDHRADLYALGVTLFEMVTGGYVPFEYSDRREILMAQIEDEPPSVKEFAPATPVMLERIIMKLLAKHPDDRYPSADVLLDLIDTMQARQQFNQRYLKLLGSEASLLIGRSEEINRLGEVWAKVRQSNTPRLLVVTGEPGIGKSRLIVQFLGDCIVDKGFRAIAGRCDELGAPYTPFAEILATIFEQGLVRPTTAESQMNRILDQIPGLASLLNIERKSPPAEKKQPRVTSGLWKTLSDRVPDNVADNPLQTQWQFFATILNILVELGPTVLFLDDAAFLDEASATLVRFLTRQAQIPLLIIAECANQGKAITWLNLFPAEDRDALTLSPLAPASVKQYLENLLGGTISDAAAYMLEKRSRGNPFHIAEMSRQLVEAGEIYLSEGEWRYTPPTDTGDLSEVLVSPLLLNAFARRLDKLSDKSRMLLALAALIEPSADFDFEVWLALIAGDAQPATVQTAPTAQTTAPAQAAAVTQAAAAAQAALEEALQRRLVRDLGNDRFAFRPADVAKALIASLPKDRRLELHRQIAKILMEKDGNPILIGYHYERAGQASEAAHYLEAAGARAIAANAIRQAIDCYKRAAGLVETQSAYIALGNLYRQQGSWADSIAALQRALELARQSGDDRQQAKILNDLSFTCWLSDQYQEAAQYASTVLKFKNISNVEAATAQSHLGMISWLLGHLKEAEAWCQKAVSLLMSSGDEGRLAGAYNRLGLVYFTKGKFADSRKITNRSLDIRRRLGDHWGEAYCLVNLGQVSAEQGDFEAGMVHFSAARQLFDKIGSNDGVMVVSAEQARALVCRGQPAQALPLIREALQLAEEIGKRSAYGLGDIHLLMAQVHLATNEVEQAMSSVENALKLIEPAGNRKYIAAGQALLAQIYERQGQPDKAEMMYKKAMLLFGQVGAPAGLWRTQVSYARFLAGRGDRVMAAKLEQQARVEAQKLGLYLKDE
jgi:serine/threonine-protein kinase